MNTARMDSLLSRQKKSLVVDTLYVLVVAIAMVIYLLGLGAGPARGAEAETPTLLAPGTIAEPAGEASACTTLAAGETADLC